MASLAVARYLFPELERIKKILRGKFVYFFLDYDGTLTPIAETPQKAVLPKETKELLRSLIALPSCKVAIISGRALRDIEKQVGLSNIVYVGNHGFEIKGPRITFESPLPRRYRATLKSIKEKLQKELSDIRGVIIEDKGFSLCVHYRQVDKNKIPLVKAAFSGALLIHEIREYVVIRMGKMLLEIRPTIPWDKGKVVLWLLARQKFASDEKGRKVLPVYIGDDFTDEDAFRDINNKGITIFVGRPRKTLAKYRVSNTDEVVRFLSEAKSAITKS